MEIQMSKYQQEQWCIVTPDGFPQLFTMKYTRSESIKRLEAVYDPKYPTGKWRHWYRKGYRCVKVKVNIKLR